jgi:hypothetical protein
MTLFPHVARSLIQEIMADYTVAEIDAAMTQIKADILNGITANSYKIGPREVSRPSLKGLWDLMSELRRLRFFLSDGNSGIGLVSFRDPI